MSRETTPRPAGDTHGYRNRKAFRGEFGEHIDIPCDCDGTFESKLVPKLQTRWTGFVVRKEKCLCPK